MLKATIQWHEECLKNFCSYAVEQWGLAKTRWAEANENNKRYMAEIEFKTRQIAEAKRQGKLAYDADKFLVKKGKRK